MDASMDCGTVCPICFSEYTTAGGHRIVSLQCGHLFGSQCIEKWAGKGARVQCPLCSIQSTKRQMRLIYASRVAAIDTEKEQMLLERCLEAERKREECMEANERLRIQMEALRAELALANEDRKRAPAFGIHRQKAFSIEARFSMLGTLLWYDEASCILVATRKSGKEVGVQKFECHDFSRTEFLGLGEGPCIRTISLSPLSNGVGAVPVGNMLNIVDIYSGNIVARYTISNQIASACFDGDDKDMVYCGDDKGMVYFIRITSPEPLKTLKVASLPIHSVCKKGLDIFASTVHQTYKIVLSGECILYPLSAEPYSICTNMSAYGCSLLFTFRGLDHRVRHFTCGRREAYFGIGAKQVRRHRDMIYKGHIYVVDDERNAIRVLLLDSLEIVYTYTFKERVLDFFVSDGLLFVLAGSSIQIFCNGV